MRTTDDEPCRWDVTLTRELVGKRYGSKQLALIRPVLRAVNVRLHHAAMHYDHLNTVTARHLDEPLKNGVSPWQLMFTNEGDTGANNLFFITCEAHLFACIQALHAAADNMAHVLYYGLGWNLEGKPPRAKVSIKTIRDRLIQLGKSRHELRAIHQPLDALVASKQFEFLGDAANHIKHHGGLHAKVSWEPSPDRPYELVLSEFERDDITHPQQVAVTFLEQAHLIMSKAVVHTGCALNEWLNGAACSSASRTNFPALEVANAV